MLKKELGNNFYTLNIPQKISVFYGEKGATPESIEGDLRSVYYAPFYLNNVLNYWQIGESEEKNIKLKFIFDEYSKS